MCDTVVASPRTTQRAVMLFGKNSDRQRNEAQTVEVCEEAEFSSGAFVECTYLTLPQVRRTFRTLLCRPFWAWGAEMGANEHGVVIGNEGVHARSAPTQEEGLPGMDLVRLGLERSATAEEAVSVITALLERYGQGGNCGHLEPSYYNNSFLVADRNSAFVLETVDREWLLERVDGVRSISNVYSIESSPERMSRGLIQMILSRGWTADENPNFAQVIADPHREHIGHACARRSRSGALLSSMQGQLTATGMMKILRDHGEDSQPLDGDAESSHAITLCMHAGSAARPGQTTGSLVSELSAGTCVHWVTGTAAPCLSVFKPVLLDVEFPLREPAPKDRYDPSTLWWRHELTHRSALFCGLRDFVDGIRSERDALEADFHARIDAVADGGSASDRRRVVAACWQEAAEAEARWSRRLRTAGDTVVMPYHSSWTKMNELAGLAANPAKASSFCM